MSASSRGSRSDQRSARLRMFSVATCRRSIGLLRGLRRSGRASAAIGSGERERRADPLLGFDPDPAAVLLDDVPRDGEARGRSRRPRRGRAPGPPCRSARRSAPGRPSGCRPRGPRRTSITSRRRRPAPRRVTSPPSGLNLTALWRRLTRTWPRRASSPRTGGTRLGHVHAQRDALALGEQAQPLDRLGRRSGRGRRRRAGSAEPPLSMRDRSSSSLTIWTRWPGLDLDLADPVAHLAPGRRRRPRPPRGSASRRAG